jgi:hypothetical protein
MGKDFLEFVTLFIGILIGIPMGWVIYKARIDNSNTKVEDPEKTLLDKEWEDQSKGYK